MKCTIILRTVLVFSLLVHFAVMVPAQNKQENQKTKTTANKKDPAHKVTFIELGSVRCIPCQKMVPVMEAVEKRFGDQVQIVFYDVWTPEGKPYGEKYKIKSIPTQIFLDDKGKEFFRHVGFFSEEEIVKVLKTKGVE